MFYAGAFARRIPPVAARHVVAFGILLGPVQRLTAEELPGRIADTIQTPSHDSRIAIGTTPGSAAGATVDPLTPRVLDPGAALDIELEQLRRERSSLTTARTSPPPYSEIDGSSTSGQRDALKRQLNELLAELARRPRPEQKPPAEKKGAERPVGARRGEKPKRNGSLKTSGEGSKSARGATSEPESVAPVDPLALAQAQFRTGDYAEALKAFERAQQTTTNPQSRTAIKYFKAACHSKLGNLQESTTLFREVANSKADDVLAECAQWQLSAQQWKESTKARLTHLLELQASLKPEPGAARAIAGSPAEGSSDRANAFE